MGTSVQSRWLVGLLIALLWITVLTPLAILWIFFLGKLYGSVVIGVQLILMAAAAWIGRKRSISEAERMRRIDKARGTPSDDARQMARGIP